MSFIDEFMKASEAAKAMDRANLPVGTLVSYRTDQGWGGSVGTHGVIKSVTASGNYVIEAYGLSGSNARIGVKDAAAGRRAFRVAATPEEFAAYEAREAVAAAQRKAEWEAKEAQRREDNARREAEAAEERRQRRAHQAAVADLIEAHATEYTRLLAKYLEA